jgi:hypothetical protein
MRELLAHVALKSQMSYDSLLINLPKRRRLVFPAHVLLKCCWQLIMCGTHQGWFLRLISVYNACLRQYRMVLMWTVRWLLSILQEMMSLEMACLDMEAMLACCLMLRAE